tara:strand:+ start:536 stop:838 length:303 start_codon:yes stop_codon:yes gene_type:complete
VLFTGDAVDGQTQPDVFNGAVEPFWMQSGPIRLRLYGDVPESVFRERFAKVRTVEADLAFTGHNPLPIEDAGRALHKVLDEGHHEMPAGFACSYLYTSLV